MRTGDHPFIQTGQAHMWDTVCQYAHHVRYLTPDELAVHQLGGLPVDDLHDITWPPMGTP